MCLVDTQTGVASGEALFLYCTFLPSTAMVKFTSQRQQPAEVIHNCCFCFSIMSKMFKSDKLKVSSPFIFAALREITFEIYLTAFVYVNKSVLDVLN